ncbi:MAG: RNA-binding protein, partial [Pseudopedobacter saltans]
MKIYVSSLSYGVGNDQLKEAFEEFGEVATANVIMDKFTQRSRGFGFVEMPNKEEAEKAISELNGRSMDGRTINVAEAKERPARTEGGYNNRSSSPFKN